MTTSIRLLGLAFGQPLGVGKGRRRHLDRVPTIRQVVHRLG